MAFTVEDGSIVAGANSLADVAYADTFHADRGDVRWTGDTSAKQAALIRATDWLEKRFAAQFKGQRVDAAQALSWPRLYAVVHGFELGSDLVPVAIKNAVATYALRALARADIAPDPALGGGSGAVIEKTLKAGPAEITTKFAEPGDTPGDEAIPRIPEGDRWLTGYLMGSSGGGISYGAVGRA